MENQLVELISTEDKLKIREFQLTILQHANLRMNLEKQFIEATKTQETAQKNLNDLLESIKPKEGKWDIQENLTWKCMDVDPIDPIDTISSGPNSLPN
jgi:hypothetical protein